MEGTSWGIVQKLGLVISSNPEGILIYGSADPLPNPSELILTREVANLLGIRWQFFIYKHGKNIPILVPEDYTNPRYVFYLEDIIPQDITLRDVTENVWALRKEPVIVAHLNHRPIRVRSTSSEILDMTIKELHDRGGWLGGSAIHYFLCKYAEENEDVLYICPFQQKGRVYEIYSGMKRELFVLSPFLRISPPPPLAPEGWEPIPWTIWQKLSAKARRRVSLIIWRAIKEFFRRGEPRRIEVPWWLLF